ncbi:MAG: hypothetical protein WDZ40_02725 [Candidatus Spechtbacterales bacterium]
MKQSEEPSRRTPVSGSADREVRIQKIHLRHITEHFQCLFVLYFKQVTRRHLSYRQMSVGQYRLRLANLFNTYAVKASNKFRGVQIKNIEQLKSNLAAVVVVFLVSVAFTHYAIATAAGTATSLNSFILKSEDTKTTEAEGVGHEDSNIEYKNEPIKTARTVSATAYSVVNVPPQEKELIITKKVWVPITAYSSTPDQTDSTPFITASGTRVRDGIVAANFLPIGTQIRIPEYYGDKVFVVEDRMNLRYWEKVDIWMPTRVEALNFGVRRTYVEVIEIN